MKTEVLYWSWFFVVWIMNIIDLIRGEYFYQSVWMIIIINVFGLCALYLAIEDKYSQSTSKEKRE